MTFKEHFSSSNKNIENIIIDYIKAYYYTFLEVNVYNKINDK